MALGARYGGIVVLDPRTGAVRADAGLGMDVTQPPGSSFKTVTASAALTAGTAALTDTYPYEKYVVLNGWRLRNFHHELCGGSFVQAFADSCNSVFAPVADEVGAKRLVAMARAFGFNEHPTIAYPAPESTTRKPAQMPSDLSLGVAGIGQGGVIASPLQMASVAQTIASRGMRHPPFIVHSPRACAATGRIRSGRRAGCRRRGHPDDGGRGELRHGHERRDLGHHGRREDGHGRGRPRPPVRCLVHRLRARRGAASGGRRPDRERRRRRRRRSADRA